MARPIIEIEAPDDAPNLQRFRREFPQYANLTDRQVADELASIIFAPEKQAEATEKEADHGRSG